MQSATQLSDAKSSRKLSDGSATKPAIGSARSPILSLVATLLEETEPRTPDQWADAHRKLPAGDSDPGEYRSARTPYVIGPSRAAVSGLWMHVFSVMFSQGGKTSLALNCIGHRLYDDPAPCLIIEPTKQLCTGPIHNKIDQMLRHCPDLWDLTLQGKAYTTTRKTVSGVSLRSAWAGSNTELAADSACFVVVDEIDRCNEHMSSEGGVLPRADARHSSYDDGITLGISSPTKGNVSVYIHPITGLEHWAHAEPEQVPSASWRYWQDGTAHEWCWPCPDCREYWVPRFKWIKWESSDQPHSTTPAEALRTGRYLCPHCGVLIESGAKDWMNARGVYVCPGQRPLAHADDDWCAWIADYTAEPAFKPRRGGEHVHEVEFGDYLPPELCHATDASFWVSGLANFGAKRTAGALAADYVRAVRTGDEEEIQSFINTGLGECFHFGGDAPPASAVENRKAPYVLGEIPVGVWRVFLTIDPGKRITRYVFRGWGAPTTEGSTLFESWLLDRGEIAYDVTDARLWEEVEALMERRFGGRKVELTAIDSGSFTSDVYEFCNRHPRRAIPTKGQPQGDRLFWPAVIDYRPSGRRSAFSIRLWHVNASQTKAWVHARIGSPTPEQAAWHLPSDIDEDYCEQLLNEEQATKPSGKVVWLRTGPNHFLDCEAMQRFLSLHLKTRLRRPPAASDDKGAAPRGSVFPQLQNARSKDPYG